MRLNEFIIFRKLLVCLTAFFCASVAQAQVFGVGAVHGRIASTPILGQLASWRVDDSLISGIYMLSHPSGSFEPYAINEAGSFLLSNQGWQRVSPANLGLPLSGVALQQLQAQLFGAVKTSEAITFTYGSGAKKVILISAFDCPSCRQLDAKLEALADKLNATIYLFPLALDFTNQRAMAVATTIWCDADPAGQWIKAMKGKPVGGGQTTICSPMRRAEQSRRLARVFSTYGVPAMIFPDGRVVRGAQSDAAILNSLR